MRVPPICSVPLTGSQNLTSRVLVEWERCLRSPRQRRSWTTIVTSDVNDITHLLASAKISHAMMGARGSASVDVVIVRV